MSERVNDFLNHMLDECSYISSILSGGMDKEMFLSDETMKRAFVRSIEIIGEATKKIPHSFRDPWPDTPWKNMAGMRDKLIHDYMGVNYHIVWDVASHFIPELESQIQKMLTKDE